jgi:hypothetical protein
VSLQLHSGAMPWDQRVAGAGVLQGRFCYPRFADAVNDASVNDLAAFGDRFCDVRPEGWT